MKGYRRQIGIVGFVVIVAAYVAAQVSEPAPDQPTPNLQTIVGRMTATQIDGRNQVRPYVVTREYQYYSGDDQQPTSEVMANVSYYPPDTKEFAITNATGSGRGERVVRKVLEHETQMAPNWRAAAMTEDNYKFSFEGEDTLNGRRCFILGVEPRRESKELLKGRAWVDAETFRIRQVTGQPAKSPSWWIKRLDLTITFADVQGMWLQTATHAEADVRLFGHNRLDARDLTYKTGAQVARKRFRAQDALGAAIMR